LLPAVALLYAGLKTAECEDDSRSEKIRGRYENKIRFFSPPEKVFEVFASKKNEETGQLVMTYGEFLRALTPYVYCGLKSDEAQKWLESLKEAPEPTGKKNGKEVSSR
jgi:hypothetical protein